MAEEAIYDIAATRGHNYRGFNNPILGAPNDKFSSFTGDNVTVVEPAGSLSISGGAGEPPPIDVSAFVQDIKSAVIHNEPEDGVLEHEFQWRPSKDNIIIEHGAVTDGPYTIGETVTDVEQNGFGSGGTATVIAVGSGFLQLGPTSGGPFERGGLLTGGSSTATSTISNPNRSVKDGEDAELAEQRFLRFVGKIGSTGVLIGNAVAIFFTFVLQGKGKRLS